MTQLESLFQGISPVWAALAGSAFAGLLSALGPLPLLFFSRISERTQAVMMGFGAGVMLAATSFSLIVPGVEVATEQTGHGMLAALVVGGGILMGGIAIWVGDCLSPHEHFIKGPEGADPGSLRRIWLFIIAITIHNFPEGLAVGVAFGGGDFSNGLSMALGIGMQNIPEGLVVAAALVAEGYAKGRAFLIALLTGLVEPVGGLLGGVAVALAQSMLPWGLAFAAGAMLYVISEEIIPESHRSGIARVATAGMMVGFVIMMCLDIGLG